MNTDEEGREKQRTRVATAPDKSLTDRWLAENKGTATAHKAEVRGGLRGWGMQHQQYRDVEIWLHLVLSSWEEVNSIF